MKTLAWRASAVGAIVAVCLGLGGTAVAATPSGKPAASSAAASMKVGRGPVEGGGVRRLTSGSSSWSAPSRPQSTPALATTYRQYIAYSNPITIQPGNWYNEWGYCPSGMVATGGGESNSSAGNILLHDDYPVAGNGGWQVTVTSTASVNETFTLYAVCMSGLNNYGPIVNKETVAPGQQLEPGVYCPYTTQVLGGGGFSDTLDTAQVETGIVGTEGWSYLAENLDTVSHTVAAEVMCGNDVTNYQVIQTATDPIPPGQEGVSVAYCPAGTWVVGGGGWGNDMTMTDSFPIYTNESWQANFYNYDTVDRYFGVQLVCGN
ncbi:MAG TPA: hypothetical protein VGM75_25470 [Pseudonocardiaceae bacterium]